MVCHIFLQTRLALYHYLIYISSIDKYLLYKTAGEEWISCHNCYKISVAPYPDSAHSFKDKCLLLLGERDFRNFSSAKVDTAKSWFSDLLQPELNHDAPTAPVVGLILMDVGYEV